MEIFGEERAQFVAVRRATDHAYRVWYSEQVTAINLDDTNNTILHYGSRGYDTYSLAQGYGIATNAVGSYFHEFIGFRNIITPFTTQTSSPLTAFPAVVSCDDHGVTALPELPTVVLSVAVSVEQPTANDHWDDDLYAFLAEEQIRSQRKKDKYSETDDWLAGFEKLALLELVK